METKEKKFVVVCSDSFEDVRCVCGALLFKALKKSKDSPDTVEMKCRKCNRIKRY